MARRSGQVIFDTISNLTFHYVGLDYFWGEVTGDVFFPSENKEHVPLCTANLTNNYTSSMQNAAALSGSASCAMNPCSMSSLPDIYASRDSTCGNTCRMLYFAFSSSARGKSVYSETREDIRKA